MSNLVIIYITFVSLEEAKVISKELLRNKLVVCTNIFSEVNSFYLWKGKIKFTSEVIAFMKSKSENVNEIIKKVEKLHSYDKPSIVVMPIKNTNESFNKWVNNTLN